MMKVDHLAHEIRLLPVRDRLRLVEQVVHDLADVSPVDESPADPFPIGLFADDPDSVDDMMKTVVEMRRRSRLTAGCPRGAGCRPYAPSAHKTPAR